MNPAENPTLPKADIAQAAAAAWLERRERGSWTSADQADFDTWLAQSPAHVVAYLRLEDVWARANRLKSLDRPKMQRFLSATRWSRVTRMAAVLVLAVGAGWWAIHTYPSAPQDAVYATDVGQRESLQLADGSQIELNTDTVLRVSRGEGAKTVTLVKGEAYFDIKHNAQRLFIVKSGDDRVVDLGTKFLVRRNTDHLKVAVFEGSARLDAKGPGAAMQSAVLMPDDVAVASGGTLSVTRKPSQTARDDMAWRRGELVFRYTTLADAAAEFNRYNQKKIVVRDAQIAQLEIGGTFGMHDVAQFSRLAHHLLGVQVTDTGTDIILSR